MTNPRPSWVMPLAAVGRGDVALVGGKNASLGEMIAHLRPVGIRVPDGFAVTADGYRHFLASNELDAVITSTLASLAADNHNLSQVGGAIRQLVLSASIPPDLAAEILQAYRKLGGPVRSAAVAVRSSATAEDLPEASFAGQMDSFLNVRGERSLLTACKRCFASLFTDRAIVYRKTHGFGDRQIALSVGVQRMVCADRAGAGVMFSIDTESGFPDAILIESAWGLGEAVVQGQVDPDRYLVFKPLLEGGPQRPIIEKSLGGKRVKVVRQRSGGSRQVRTLLRERQRFVLSDDEVLALARSACVVERHYGQPMDMEWAKDGDDGQLYLLQARPETVQSRRGVTTLRQYRLAARGASLVRGLAIGDAIATGEVRVLESLADLEDFEPGCVLVTRTTGPDWVPVMKQAAAIVTEQGGRTSHAAIIARELGLPAVVGATDASRLLAPGLEVTVSCAEGATGQVYRGRLPFSMEESDVSRIPDTRTDVMLNLADPGAALRAWRLPADGVGLARMEFIISHHIRVHPLALLHPERVVDPKQRRQIAQLTQGYADPADYFVDVLSRGMAQIAASQYPKPVVVRLSDFKTNEYAQLLGGAAFEPRESNPMLGWRGASRYDSPGYREGFALECRAVAVARKVLGLRNIVIMVPFCRTLGEADRVLAALASHGLRRGEDDLLVYVMAELPSNVLLAEDFAARFDGFSIGSNDLTQLILGVDRDSELLSDVFDERDPAVIKAIADLLRRARHCGIHTAICGQAPSDHPEFARFLVEQGIDALSVTPDRFIAVKQEVARIEAELDRSRG